MLALDHRVFDEHLVVDLTAIQVRGSLDDHAPTHAHGKSVAARHQHSGFHPGPRAQPQVALESGTKLSIGLFYKLHIYASLITVDYDLFVAGRGDTAATLATIKKYHDQQDYVLDPHTAVGVYVAEQFQSLESPTICLATAHPAKFTQAIVDAIGEEVHHPTLDALANAETRCESIQNDVDAVKEYLVAHI